MIVHFELPGALWPLRAQHVKPTGAIDYCKPYRSVSQLLKTITRRPLLYNVELPGALCPLALALVGDNQWLEAQCSDRLFVRQEALK